MRLGTRGSALAVTQSTWVADRLRALGTDVELVTVKTRGDRERGSLTRIAGLGVFAAELRATLLRGEVDCAVHSLKDLPVDPVPGLVVAAIPERESAMDALCSRDGLRLEDLPPGARVGTGSPRRAAQLRRLRPDLVFVDIRGNIDTRLARLAPGDLDAVLLAAAGLRRLGLQGRITQEIPILPAPGQGALAVECRADDAGTLAALAPLDDPDTRLATSEERAVLAALGGGCAAPIGALGTPGGGVADGGAARDGAARGEADGGIADGETPGGGASRGGTTHDRAARGGASRGGVTRSRVDGGIVGGGEVARGETSHGGVADGGTTRGGVAGDGTSRGEAAELHAGVFSADGGDGIRVTVPLAPGSGRRAAALLLAKGAAQVTELDASRASRLAEFHDDAALWPEASGTEVFVPRPAGALSQALAGKGLAVTACPVQARRTLAHSPEEIERLRSVRAEWSVITSARTVETLRELDVRLPGRIAAVGRASAAAAEAEGYDVELVPGVQSARGLLAEFPARARGGADAGRDASSGNDPGSGRVFLPCSALARPELAEGLRSLGWQVAARPVYTMEPVEIPAEVAERWRAGAFAAVVVTSGSVARAIDSALGWPAATRVLAIGQPTAEVLRELGVAASVSKSPAAADVAAAAAELVGKGNV